MEEFSLLKNIQATPENKMTSSSTISDGLGRVRESDVSNDRSNEMMHEMSDEISHEALETEMDSDGLNNDDFIHFCGRDWIVAFAWRIRQSTPYFLLYLILIILNAFVLLFEVLGGKSRKAIIILEAIITLMFVGEVLIEVITQEWHNYWQSWMNRLDFIVCILCVILFLIFAIIEEAPHSHYNIESYMDSIIVGIRYGVQAIRFIRFAHKGRQNRRMLDPDNIVFNHHITHTVLQQHGLEERNDMLTNNNGNTNSINRKTNENVIDNRMNNRNRKKKKKQTRKYQTIDEIEMVYMDNDDNASHTADNDNNDGIDGNDDNEDNEESDLTESNQSDSDINPMIAKEKKDSKDSKDSRDSKDSKDRKDKNDNNNSNNSNSSNSSNSSKSGIAPFDKAAMVEMLHSEHDLEQTQIYQNIISNEMLSSDDDHVKRQLLRRNPN